MLFIYPAVFENLDLEERIRGVNLSVASFPILIVKQTIPKQVMNYSYRDPPAEIMREGRRSMMEDHVRFLPARCCAAFDRSNFIRGYA